LHHEKTTKLDTLSEVCRANKYKNSFLRNCAQSACAQSGEVIVRTGTFLYRAHK